MNRSNLKIRIMRDAYTKLFYFVDKCDVEIGFMGKVIYNPSQMSYDILAVHVPHQEVTGSTTDLDAQAVANLDAETIGEKGHLNAWLHSHVNMGVFWSGTDKDTIFELGSQGLCVAVVVNKKREMRGAVYWKGHENKEDFYPGFPNEGFLDELQIEVVDRVDGKAKWDEEMTTKVRKKVYPAYTGGTHGGKNTTQTTTTGGTGATATDSVKYYENLINAFQIELENDCLQNAQTGELILTKRQKSRMKYLCEQLAKWEAKAVEEELKAKDDKQLSLIKDDMQSTQASTFFNPGEEIYTDVELFDMTFVELDSELKHLVAQGLINEQVRTYWQGQWRTCGVRLKKV